jgi:hypothetical protein
MAPEERFSGAAFQVAFKIDGPLRGAVLPAIAVVG